MVVFECPRKQWNFVEDDLRSGQERMRTIDKLDGARTKAYD